MCAITKCCSAMQAKINECEYFFICASMHTLGAGACPYFTIGNILRKLPLFVQVDDGGWFYCSNLSVWIDHGAGFAVMKLLQSFPGYPVGD